MIEYGVADPEHAMNTHDGNDSTESESADIEGIEGENNREVLLHTVLTACTYHQIGTEKISPSLTSQRTDK